MAFWSIPLFFFHRSVRAARKGRAGFATRYCLSVSREEVQGAPALLKHTIIGAPMMMDFVLQFRRERSPHVGPPFSPKLKDRVHSHGGPNVQTPSLLLMSFVKERQPALQSLSWSLD